MAKNNAVDQAYQLAKASYAKLGVDTDKALEALKGIPVSLHCWQGDDVGGFEHAGQLDGGLAVTGNYPGKARTADELRADADQAYRLIPGKHRFALHAIYAEFGGKKVDRNRSRAGAFRPLDRLGQGTRAGAGFQSDLFFASEGGIAVLPCRIATRASASSGLSTGSPAARSVRRWARPWAARP